MPIRLVLTQLENADEAGAVEVQFGTQPVVKLKDGSEVLSAVQVCMCRVSPAFIGLNGRKTCWEPFKYPAGDLSCR
jgi:hypothetical protein